MFIHKNQSSLPPLILEKELAELKKVTKNFFHQVADGALRLYSNIISGGSYEVGLENGELTEIQKGVMVEATD